MAILPTNLEGVVGEKSLNNSLTTTPVGLEEAPYGCSAIDGCADVCHALVLAGAGEDAKTDALVLEQLPLNWKGSSGRLNFQISCSLHLEERY